MKIASSMTLLTAVAAAAMGVGLAAQAEEYRVVPADHVTVCQVPAEADWVQLEGPRDVQVARADGDTLNAAVCAGDDGAVNVRWRANGYWKTTGNIAGGCAEILGASKIKVRAVDTNFHQTAAYQACVQE
jgi:hypothetical protein